MNENEERAFRETYQFYAKWRETIIETDEQWLDFARDVQKTGADLEGNQLGQRLLSAAVESICDLYKNGMKPMPAGYFGREDL